MKKKIMVFMTGLVMTGLFAACTANVDVPASEASTTAEEVTAEAETEEDATEEASTEATTEATTEESFAPNEASGDTEEEGQNPFMNFTGIYNCDMANLEVECDGKDGAKITVIWGDGISQSSEWKMNVKWNDDLLFEYEKCVKKTYTYSEDAELEEERVDYEDGTGRFDFSNNEITWTDDKEGIAYGMTFISQPAPGAPDEAGE